MLAFVGVAVVLVLILMFRVMTWFSTLDVGESDSLVVCIDVLALVLVSSNCHRFFHGSKKISS